ncbi:hypothetical protein JKF63_01739 [Porcisia hertigi]|uniref:Uncharacterized protein n=1 Tax=Porcisia hertigi TaxID=2761500 RepID=A0A836HWR7_9TRYP|nr:hypothetical protein JKF63_01739 [Porcisia hertigi]
MWGFEEYAEGLSIFTEKYDAPLTGTTPEGGSAAPLPPPRHLYKQNRNNDLFNAQGKLLNTTEAQGATTWRTHHAFSGRCALVNLSAPADDAVSHPLNPSSWAEQAWTAYQNWSISFHLRSTATDEPHILLSVAPAYFPNLVSSTGERHEADAATLASLPCAPSAEEEVMYNKRILETPLIWEEPYALSVDCTPHGVFLWSDHWGIFGQKISERCLELHADNAGENETATMPFYDAALRLRWNANGAENPSSTDGVCVRGVTPTLTVELKKTSDNAADGATSTARVEKMKQEVWQHLIDLPLPLDYVALKAAFRPYVTLMEGGDSVELL